AGGRARVAPAAHDHAQPRPHVPHRSSQRRARRPVNVRFLPAGDCALAVELEGEIGPALAMRLRALEALISGGRVDGIVETVPSFRSLLVYYEPARIGYGALCEAIAANLSAAAEAELPS